MAVVKNENGVIKGLVRCILCDLELENGNMRKKRRCEFYSQYWNGQRWCLSNFTNHHLHIQHPITNDPHQKEIDSDDTKSGMVCNQHKTNQTKNQNDYDDDISEMIQDKGKLKPNFNEPFLPNNDQNTIKSSEVIVTEESMLP